MLTRTVRHHGASPCHNQAVLQSLLPWKKTFPASSFTATERPGISGMTSLYVSEITYPDFTEQVFASCTVVIAKRSCLEAAPEDIDATYLRIRPQAGGSPVSDRSSSTVLRSALGPKNTNPRRHVSSFVSSEMQRSALGDADLVHDWVKDFSAQQVARDC